MSRFMVTWEAEIEATSYLAAAENARAILWRNGQSAESEFMVQEIVEEAEWEPALCKVDAVTGDIREVVPSHDELVRPAGV